MNDATLLLALGIRLVMLVAALVHLGNSVGMYRHYHDVRGLRGAVSAFALLGGVFAIIGLSPVLRAAYPDAMPVMRILSTAGIVMLLIGLLFAVSTWRHRA